MSSKFGLILSLMFVGIFLAFCADLINIQYNYTLLDSQATVISYRISQHGTLDDDFISNIEEEMSLEFTCIGNCNPQYGDVVNYIVSKSINPLVVSKHVMTLSIERSAVIGFYA